LLFAIVVALLIGGLAPTPLFQEYFYAPIPLMILAPVYAASGGAPSGPLGRGWRRAFCALTIISIPYVVLGYRDIWRIGFVNEWVPMRVHERGCEIAARARQGYILTLAPIFPLDGR